MPQIFQKLPPFENMSAADPATAIIPRVPMGNIYDCIALKLIGTFVAADITRVSMKLGGKDVTAGIDGTELDEMNQYFSLTNNADYLPFHFADRQAKTINGRRLGALDTKHFDYSDFQIEVDVDGVQSGASMEALALLGGDKPSGTEAMFRCLMRSVHAPGAAGQFNLPIATGSGIGNLLRAIIAYHANITHFELKKDAINIADNRAIADYQFFQNEILRTTQAGQFVWDALIDGDQSDVLDLRRFDQNGKPVGISAMQYLYTVSGADTIRAYADMYATIKSL
jgi:hypothetical protein